MKKQTYIFFVLLAFVALFAAYPVMKLMQWQAREEIWQHISARNLPDSLLDHFTDIDKDAAVQWEEEGRECHIGDKLYDVVGTETVDGHTIFHCICDERETQILDILDGMAAREAPADIPCQRLVIKLIRELFSIYLVPSVSAPSAVFLQSQADPAGHFCASLQDCLREVTIPPPEAA